MGKVEMLPTAASEEIKLPPFDVTITMNISGERQIIVRSPAPDALLPEEANRRLDALVTTVERQRAKYELLYLNDQLSDKRAALALWEKRRDEAEAEHKAAQEKRAEEIADLKVKRADLEARIAHEWTARGRRGNPKLEGADKSRDQRMAQAIEIKLAEIAKADAEHQQNVQTALKSIEKLTEEIRAIERLMEKHRKIVG
jgi:hypothetical protein